MADAKIKVIAENHDSIECNSEFAAFPAMKDTVILWTKNDQVISATAGDPCELE